MKTGSKISLIIATRWASDVLRLCIKSIRENAVYSDNELIVIADLPSWQTIKVLQEAQQRYYTVPYGHLFMSYNEGARRATKEYFAFANDDMIFGPCWDEALMEIMKEPHTLGSLYRMERNTGYDMFGYDGKDPKTFDYDKFCTYVAKNSSEKMESTHAAPTTCLAKYFWKVRGFTFHTGHGHGHENQLEKRLTIQCGVYPRRTSLSAIYHFGAAGNQDQLQENLWGQEAQYCYRSGLLICDRCRVQREGFGGDEASKDAETVKVRGYWMCENCRDDEWELNEKGR